MMNEAEDKKQRTKENKRTVNTIKHFHSFLRQAIVYI